MQSWQLKNDIQVCYEPEALPGLAAIQVIMPQGSYKEPIRGMAHLMEHLKCSEFQSAGREVLEHFNAFTGLLETHYQLGALHEDFPRVACNLLDTIYKRSPSQAMLDKERSIVNREMLEQRINAHKPLSATQKLLRALFASDWYDYDALGTQDSLSKISLADIEAFNSAAYATPASKVFITGALPRADLERVLDTLEGYARRKRSLIEPPAVHVVDRPVRLEHAEEGPPGLAYLQIAHQTPNPVMTDGAAYAIISHALYGPQGRIRDIFREQMHAAYGIEANKLRIGPRHGQYVSIPCAPDTLERTHHILFEQFERIRQEGISQAELDVLQKQVRISSLQRRSSSNWEIIGDMISTDDHGMSSNEFLASLRDVSQDEIRYAAQRYLPKPTTPHVQQNVVYTGNREAAPVTGPVTFI